MATFDNGGTIRVNLIRAGKGLIVYYLALYSSIKEKYRIWSVWRVWNMIKSCTEAITGKWSFSRAYWFFGSAPVTVCQAWSSSSLVVSMARASYWVPASSKQADYEAFHWQGPACPSPKVPISAWSCQHPLAPPRLGPVASTPLHTSEATGEATIWSQACNAVLSI